MNNTLGSKSLLRSRHPLIYFRAKRKRLLEDKMLLRVFQGLFLDILPFPVSWVCLSKTSCEFSHYEFDSPILIMESNASSLIREFNLYIKIAFIAFLPYLLFLLLALFVILYLDAVRATNSGLLTPGRHQSPLPLRLGPLQVQRRLPFHFHGLGGVRESLMLTFCILWLRFLVLVSTSLCVLNL